MPPAVAALAQAETRFRAGDDGAALRLLLEHPADLACSVRAREWAVMERRLDLLRGILPQLEARDHPEATVSRAVHAQLGGDAATALELLKPLLGSHADLATAHHHAGRALHNLGRRAEALAALRLATRLDPDYAEAWYSLAHALRGSGRLEDAVATYHAVLARRPGSRAALLNLGITLCAHERAAEAVPVLDNLLERAPDHLEGWINKGVCLHVLGRIEEARACYERALHTAPGHAHAHFYLGCLLNETMDGDAARTHLEAALRADPDNPDVLTELAGVAEQCNDVDDAQRHVDHGLSVHPDHPGLLLEAARLFRRSGHATAARERLLAVDAAALPARQAQQYWFERALVHDRTREPEAAMQALLKAHAIAASSPRRSAIDHDAFPRRLQQVDDWLAAGAAGAQPAPSDPPLQLPFRPAFLVGFPRSGTTLLDTIFGVHPAVCSIEERATLESASEELLSDGSAYPGAMPRLQQADVVRARARYLAAVRPLLPEGEFTGVVLDKLPLRLLRVPLIHRLFPDAPILFAARHPCDVVLSNLMQQYRPNEAFVHFDTLEDIARTYDHMLRLWRRMTELLPLRVHTVRYEGLVRDPRTELQAACDALGIACQQEMLDPARRLGGRGRVQTNSYAQVAEPLYARAVDRWQRYRPWLQPVLPLLREHALWLGYPDPGAD